MKVDVYYALRFIKDYDDSSKYNGCFFGEFNKDKIIIFVKTFSLPSHPQQGQVFLFREEPISGDDQDNIPQGITIELSGYREDKDGKIRPFCAISDNFGFDEWCEECDLGTLNDALLEWDSMIERAFDSHKDPESHFSIQGWKVFFETPLKPA